MIDPTVLLVAVDDLIFLSRIQQEAGRVGIPVEKVLSVVEVESKSQRGAPMLIVDLNAEGFSAMDLVEAVRKLRTPTETKIIGFFSHVQQGLKQQAEKVGCDLVLPRSRFIEILHSLLRRERV